MGEVSVAEKKQVLQHVFQQYDAEHKGELTPIQIQILHGDIRMGGVSLPQVFASIKYTCVGEQCQVSELYDLLQEMDRRYFLLQDLKWEFSLLDRQNADTISVEQARWFVQAVHGKHFSRRKWDHFVKNRAVPGSSISFAEIEVILCDIPSRTELEDEQRQMQLEEKEKLRRKKEFEDALEKEREKMRQEKEEQRKRKQNRQKLLKQLDKFEVDLWAQVKDQEDEERRKRREDEEQRRRKEEERLRREREEEEERLRKLQEEERRRREEDEEKYRDAERLHDEAEKAEKDADEKLKHLRKRKDGADGKRKAELEDEENRLNKHLKEHRNKRIRYQLKVAVKSRDKFKLEYSITEFKKAELSDDDMDLEKAQRLLKQINATDGLHKAMSKREIQEIEKAMAFVRKHGFEVELAREMASAGKLLSRLRRLERIRHEILELKQSTVAEIRSYTNPPPIVHTVMTAVFLLLGHAEKETKNWKAVQALVGKTGKESLKRRCLELKPEKLAVNIVKRGKALLDKFELDDVRDISAGAATFFVWATATIEDVLDREEDVTDVQA